MNVNATWHDRTNVAGGAVNERTTHGRTNERVNERAVT